MEQQLSQEQQEFLDKQIFVSYTFTDREMAEALAIETRTASEILSAKLGHPKAENTWKPKFYFGRNPELLTGVGRDEYMWRWKVAQWLGYELRFHMFRSSDPDDMHDHPFWFLSLLLAGTYTEQFEDPETKETKTIIRKGLSLAYRRATHKHRVLVPDGPALTLVLSGRRSRAWGFWPTCKDGITKQWQYWKDYVNGHHIC